mmetsp:Transcript_21540/g.44946  ORF Transcript_21540/g.44946 Transcript_21540/m.44946 type:complete len:168 (+) Transcript_21540:797-1300(+)
MNPEGPAMSPECRLDVSTYISEREFSTRFGTEFFTITVGMAHEATEDLLCGAVQRRHAVFPLVYRSAETSRTFVKRFSDFEKLFRACEKSFRDESDAHGLVAPQLPPKTELSDAVSCTLIRRLDEDFLEERSSLLAAMMHALLVQSNAEKADGGPAAITRAAENFLR